MNLSFTNPMLLGLLPLPFLLLWWRSRQTPSAIVWPSIQGFEGLPTARWPIIVSETLRFLIVLALVIALAGPRTPDEKTRIVTQGIAIMLVLDTSGSMEESTFQWQNESSPITRREAAKRVFRLFIAGGEGPDGTKLEGRSTNRGTDAIGLVTFSTLPQTVCPPTLNHSVLLEVLNNVPAASVVDTATNIGDALAEGLLRLDKAEPKRRVLILLSDGEHNYDLADPERAPLKPRQAAKLAATQGVPIYAIDTGGEPVAGADGDARRAGRLINQQIAEMTGGKSFVANDGSQLLEVCRQIDELERQPVVSPVYRRYHDYVPWLIGSAIVLLLTLLLWEHSWGRQLP